MKSGAFAFILLATAVARAASQSAPACSGSPSLECRERFIHQNLNIHKPDPADPHDAAMLQDIKDFIEKSRKLLAGKKQHANDELTMADGFIFSPTSPSSWIKRYNHEKERNQKAYDAALKHIAEVDNERYAAYNHIMAETIQLYHMVPDVVVPADSSGVQVPQPIKTWAPHYSETAVLDDAGHGRLRTPVEIMDLRRKYHLIVDDQHMDDPITAGTSTDDSRISVFPSAFTTPEQIAESIYHETVHWLDRVALGSKQTRVAHNQSEVMAYQAVIDARDVFKLTDAQVKQLSITREQYQKQATAIINGSLEDESGWAPSTALEIPKSAPPENESGFDDIHAIVNEKIRQAREIAGRQEREARIQEENRASDEKLRETLADIAVRICEGGAVGEDELDALPIQNHSRFLTGIMPSSVVGAGCPHMIFMTMGLDLAHGRRPSVEEVESLARDRERMAAAVPANTTIPARPAPPPPIPAARAATPVRNERRMVAFLDLQVKIMRDIVKSACETNTPLSEDARDRFVGAYENLIENRTPHDNRLTIEGYDPFSAVDGLQGCNYDLMLAYIQSPGLETKYLNYNGSSVLLKYHPAPLPIPYQAPGRPPPDAKPKTCEDYGNHYCP
jgi:hypothetical protein